MRIAVCIGGLQRPVTGFRYADLENTMFHAFRNVEADFYYQTWNKNLLIDRDRNVLVLPEPNIHYNPVHDPKTITGPWIARKKADKNNPHPKLFHSTKQILAHAYIIKNLSKSYDMIVRCRYDLYFSRSLNYKNLLERSYEEGPYGMGSQTGRMTPKDLNLLNNPKMLRKTNDNDRWKGMLTDALIFHKPEHFDTKYVEHLHDQKELLAAEAGWYQILSQPFNDHHTNFAGGVLASLSGRLK